ncbi:MAG: class I adenylate cyclase, partial [Bradymonadia bacterium]
ELALGQGLITKWGWDSTTLQLTDHLDSLNRIFHLYVHKRLNEFVIGLYRNLSDAARDKKGRFDETEFTLLGRRLLAHFSPKNTRVGVHYAYTFHEDISRNVISVEKTESEESGAMWTLSAGQTSSELGRMIEVWQGKSLLHGLGWLAASGVFRSTSTLKFEGLSSRMSQGFVEDILNEISDMTSELDPLVVGAKYFTQIPTLRRAVIILNFEDFENPVEDVRTGRKHYLPSNWDILNYGREQESRLRDVAVISTDSWDVCSLRRVKGKDSIRQALRWVYSGRSYSHGKFKVPMVFAPDGREHRAGQDRLMQLLMKIESLFEPSLRIDECSSFLYEVGNRFQVLQRRGDDVHCFQTSDLSRAMRLATPSHMPVTQLHFDGLAPSLSLVNVLRERASRDQDVEVFMAWRKGPMDSELFVIDSTQRVYRATAHPKRFDALFVGTMRRLIYILRDRAHDMRTLRKLLKVYEAKDGAVGQTGLQLADDTVRALRYVGAHPPNSLQITVGGDLGDGRSGLYYEVNDKIFRASESGRRFTLECVLHALETVSKSSETGFRIERSDVEFIRAEKASATDAVRHLRVMDMCQAQLYRTVGHLKSGGKSILNSQNKFGKGGLNA